jgi:hypothetical protein
MNKNQDQHQDKNRDKSRNPQQQTQQSGKNSNWDQSGRQPDGKQGPAKEGQAKQGRDDVKSASRAQDQVTAPTRAAKGDDELMSNPAKKA